MDSSQLKLATRTPQKARFSVDIGISQDDTMQTEVSVNPFHHHSSILSSKHSLSRLFKCSHFLTTYYNTVKINTIQLKLISIGKKEDFNKCIWEKGKWEGRGKEEYKDADFWMQFEMIPHECRSFDPVIPHTFC